MLYSTSVPLEPAHHPSASDSSTHLHYRWCLSFRHEVSNDARRKMKSNLSSPVYRHMIHDPPHEPNKWHIDPKNNQPGYGLARSISCKHNTKCTFINVHSTKWCGGRDGQLHQMACTSLGFSSKSRWRLRSRLSRTRLLQVNLKGVPGSR